MSTAARAAAAKGPSGTLPQGSALLWALLQHCLKQQAEALIEQQSYKAAAKEAMAQVGLPCTPCDPDVLCAWPLLVSQWCVTALMLIGKRLPNLH